MKYIKKLNIDFNDWIEINIPNDFIDHEDFYQFLIDNNILHKYVNNFYNCKDISISRIRDNFTTIKMYLNFYSKSQFISSAFNWINTPEKYHFWEDYYIKWSHLLTN